MTSAQNVEELKRALYHNGIVGLPGCFTPAWADQLNDDFLAAFTAAQSYAGGTIGADHSGTTSLSHPNGFAASSI